MLLRFCSIDASDQGIIKLQDNFVREPRKCEHFWRIWYLISICCYPHDESICAGMEHQPNVQDDIMFCTVCKAEVRLPNVFMIEIVN